MEELLITARDGARLVCWDFAGEGKPLFMVLYGALIILFNLLADLCYAWIDPRVRLR